MRQIPSRLALSILALGGLLAALFTASVPAIASAQGGPGSSSSAASTATPPPGGQQLGLPDSPQNLQVLPADMSTRAVIGVMRGFAQGLGVRCIHCHVGDDPSDLGSTDFASDEKETKRIARVMMQMVGAINDEHIASLASLGREPTVEVGCSTCHHGQARPVTLQTVLTDAYGEGGIDGAIEEYRSLRERYFGSWTYDFSEGTLSGIATSLARQGDGEGALAMIDLNQEFFPDSPGVHVARAQVYQVLEDPEGMRTALEACVAADPEGQTGGFCRQQLARLEGQQ